jgi:hypothetical protein
MFFRSINLDYDYSFFTDQDHEQFAKHSCTAHQQTDNPKLYKKLGGIPDSYTLENTTIYQLWYDDKKLKKDLGNKLGIEVVSVSTIMQPCGSSIPIHTDHFHKIRLEFPNDTRTKVRANIFLQDWKPGHHLQYKINDEWKISTHWKAGEGFTWDSTVEHLSGNSGMSPKHTLQVSGFLVN